MGLIADKLKQPTLVAYLVAGIIIGPGLLAWADPTELVELMAELGLAFLLFLIGLKLDFGEIEHIYKPILKISIPQMISVAIFSILISIFMGFNLINSLILGLAFMYSSTAVVIKLLKDSGGISKQYGKINTGILLIQDLTVVILMVLISSGETGLVSGLGSAFGFLIIAALTVLILSHTILPKILKEASKNSINLFVTGLAWLFIFILAAEYFGLSIEVGAFIAGLGLGQIKYSKELVEKMSPITNFFIAIFFINFGLSLSIGDFLTYWREGIILSALLMIIKFGAITWLVDWQGFSKETSFKSGITMTQTSEFSLIFAAAAATAGLLTEPQVGLISLVAIITMSTSSYLILFHNQIFNRFYPGTSDLSSEKEARKNHAIIAGYTEDLEEITRILEQKYTEVIVVDRKPEIEDKFKDVKFGDFHHRDLRKELGVHTADFIMVNFEDESLIKEIKEEAKEECLILANLENEIEGVKTYFEEELLSEKLKQWLSEADV